MIRAKLLAFQFNFLLNCDARVQLLSNRTSAVNNKKQRFLNGLLTLLPLVPNIVQNRVMSKRLQKIGNSLGIIVDKPILDLLRITADTELDLSTDGRRLIVTPLSPEERSSRLARVQERILESHADTFRKLAE